jgi:hypothetical protein
MSKISDEIKELAQELCKSEDKKKELQELIRKFSIEDFKDLYKSLDEAGKMEVKQAVIDLAKAKAHKYIRKEGVGKKAKYIYREDEKKGEGRKSTLEMLNNIVEYAENRINEIEPKEKIIQPKIVQTENISGKKVEIKQIEEAGGAHYKALVDGKALADEQGVEFMDFSEKAALDRAKKTLEKAPEKKASHAELRQKATDKVTDMISKVIAEKNKDLKDAGKLEMKWGEGEGEISEKILRTSGFNILDKYYNLAYREPNNPNIAHVVRFFGGTKPSKEEHEWFQGLNDKHQETIVKNAVKKLMGDVKKSQESEIDLEKSIDQLIAEIYFGEKCVIEEQNVSEHDNLNQENEPVKAKGEEIAKSTDEMITELMEGEELEKAHKYIRKIGVGPSAKYIYKEGEKKETSKEEPKKEESVSPRQKMDKITSEARKLIDPKAEIIEDKQKLAPSMISPFHSGQKALPGKEEELKKLASEFMSARKDYIKELASKKSLTKSIDELISEQEFGMEVEGSEEIQELTPAQAGIYKAVPITESTDELIKAMEEKSKKINENKIDDSPEIKKAILERILEFFNEKKNK